MRATLDFSLLQNLTISHCQSQLPADIDIIYLTAFPGFSLFILTERSSSEVRIAGARISFVGATPRRWWSDSNQNKSGTVAVAVAARYAIATSRILTL